VIATKVMHLSNASDNLHKSTDGIVERMKYIEHESEAEFDI
jgi:hypothetical protein